MGKHFCLHVLRAAVPSAFVFLSFSMYTNTARAAEHSGLVGTISNAAGSAAASQQASVTPYRIKKLVLDMRDGSPCSKANPDLCPVGEDVISVVDQLGAKPRALVKGSEAAWTADGSRLAFCQEFGPATRLGHLPAPITQIMVVNADGTGLHQVSNRTKGACEPAWSPDGKQIVFRAGGQGIYVADASGQNPLRIAVGRNPQWSPDGKRILFLTSGANCDCKDASDPHVSKPHVSAWVINADGSGKQKIYTEQVDHASRVNAAWYPDGQSIVMPLHSGLSTYAYRIGLDGVRHEKISEAKIGDVVFAGVSPDGHQLIAIEQPFTDSDSYNLRPGWDLTGEPAVVLIDAQGKRKTIGVGRNPSILWQP
jgi:Tol biopolymer transport system component